MCYLQLAARTLLQYMFGVAHWGDDRMLDEGDSSDVYKQAAYGS